MTRHDPTDTVFAEVHGDPCAILRVAVQVQGAGFHPDDDPREVIDADGLRVWDDADAAEIVAALNELQADGVEYIGHEAEGCTGGPDCEQASRRTTMTNTIFDGSGWWYLCIECGRSGVTHREQAGADIEAVEHRCSPSDRD